MKSAFKIGGIEGAGPSSPDARFGCGSGVKVSKVVESCASVGVGAWIVVPHEAINVCPREFVASWVYELCEFVNELTDLSSVWGGVLEEEIENFSATVSEFECDGAVVEAVLLSNGAALMSDADIHHVEVPRNGNPSRFGAVGISAMVEAVIASKAEVDVADDAVAGSEAEILFEIEVFPPPSFGVGAV